MKYLIIHIKSEKPLLGWMKKPLEFSSMDNAQELANQLFRSEDEYYIEGIGEEVKEVGKSNPLSFVLGGKVGKKC